MAIHKSLQDIHPTFMQKCPLCGRANRIIVKGVYNYNGKREIYPDIGYSFCNCKCIFYTNYENIKIKTHSGFNHYEHPMEELKNAFNSMPSGTTLSMFMPDPFFCEWSKDPYDFEHWNPRFNHVIFDMEQFCDDAKEIGFEIVLARRNVDVLSKNPKTMEIILKKP